MSDVNAAAAPPVPTADSLRGAAIIGYGLFLAAYFTAGLTAVAAVVLAYIKQSEAVGTVWASHFHNQIVVFWVTAITFVLAVPLYLLSIGLAILFGIVAWPVSLFAAPFILLALCFPFGLIVVVWFLYRVIKGLVRASESKAYN
ncbi:MAG TPA: hypothetical protein VIJ62_09530 [Rhizomicrobium sp.]